MRTPSIDIRKIPRNRLINPELRYWQRGNSLTSTDSVYLADRFLTAITGTNPVRTRSTDIPTELEDYLDYSFEFSADSFADTERIFISQRLESKDVRDLVGKKVLVSFYYKGTLADLNTSISNSYIELRSADALDDFTTETSIEAKSITTLTIDDTWRRATLEFAALPAAAANGLSLFIRMEALSSVGAKNMKFTGFMLHEAASGQLDFQSLQRSQEEELRKCLRYYEKCLDLDTPFPAAYSSLPGRGIYFARAAGDSFFTVHFKEYKRIAPVLTTYSSAGTPGSTAIGEAGFSGLASGLAASASFSYIWEADSEL